MGKDSVKFKYIFKKDYNPKYAKLSYDENDQLLIYLSGHGFFDDLFGQGYLVTTDSKIDDEVRTTYISYSILREVINSIPVPHIYFIIDASFGGTFDMQIGNTGRR